MMSKIFAVFHPFLPLNYWHIKGLILEMFETHTDHYFAESHYIYTKGTQGDLTMKVQKKMKISSF